MEKCKKEGSINSIETFGLVDGPGIRTVVFLNGCHLRCKYCHNPEMWLKQKNNYSVNDLVKKILKNKVYYGEKGGVTFSGGEPLLQSKFLLKVCKKLKKENIHICLDTAGIGNNYKELLKYVDLILLDIKHVELNEYSELTSHNMDDFLSFVNYINLINKKVWLRQVIVPGLNDNEEYLEKLNKFIKKIKNVEKIEFLPYHNLAIEKYKILGIDYIYKDKMEMSKDKCDLLYKKFINLQ